MGIEPTPKAQGVLSFMKFLTGTTREEAADKNICVMCRREHIEFRDAQSRIEANISGLCQVCQDDVFGE